MTNSETRFDVIHIRGSGRSGSTLLNILLDDCDQVFAGAELFRYDRLWRRIDTLVTADGTPVKDSEFWNSVKVHLENNEQLERFINSTAELDAVNIRNLLSSIASTSGKPIICDTSKSAEYSKHLYNAASNTVIVHLVRDGRAVARSMKNSGIGKLKFPIVWTITNLKIWAKYRNNPDYVNLSYEDVVFSTDNSLSKIFSVAEKQFGTSLTFSGKDETAQYAFAGNRMRSSFTGAIKFDSTYLDEITGFYWWFLTILMLPALVLFKFPLSRRGVRSRIKFLESKGKS